MREKEFVGGYAIAYEDIIQYILTIIPQEEVIVESTRKSVLSFPEITTKEDRIRACYMQACLAYVNFSAISNADIRAIFGLSDKDKVKISRVIKDTIEKSLIKPLDPNTAPRYMKYIPHWA